MNVSLRMRKRVQGGWGEARDVEMTVEEAAPIVAASRGKNFDNTKIGDEIVLSIGGTLSAIFETKIQAGYKPEELLAEAQNENDLHHF